MTVRPHDITDLLLAPTLIDLDDVLEQLGELNPGELAFEIILATNQEPLDAGERAAMLLESLRVRLDLHRWDLALTDRGLSVEHGGRAVVLGLPSNVRDYLAG
ncbi:hypothetical protein [Nocardioides sp. T2.26MG-1]|uniref:hypothetical protein n=1 Tax=Nocardioides sp. T2.26MG-1 TaxID=3041166 RepID=UPI00247792CE|nr:hypothetical protein [Nocardioides sp. T2.26MG-1]CAI9413581.1 hypothetical protein HIDPHFAB_02057 [Nocardioides sp. T2.26MG-1]